MGGEFLLDTSSLIYVLKLRRIDVLQGNYIQQLTVYEAINAIWKEAYLVKSLTPEEAEELAEIVSRVLEYLKILSIHPYETETLRKAVELGLTVYDASYIALAKRKNLILITEDERLREEANRTAVKAVSIKELIK